MISIGAGKSSSVLVCDNMSFQVCCEPYRAANPRYIAARPKCQILMTSGERGEQFPTIAWRTLVLFVFQLAAHSSDKKIQFLRIIGKNELLRLRVISGSPSSTFRQQTMNHLPAAAKMLSQGALTLTVFRSDMMCSYLCLPVTHFSVIKSSLYSKNWYNQFFLENVWKCCISFAISSKEVSRLENTLVIMENPAGRYKTGCCTVFGKIIFFLNRIFHRKCQFLA
jgi:hypothetical protein